MVSNIHDEDGFLIYPDEYQEKIQTNSIVLVNVHFKMYVFLNMKIYLNYYYWFIRKVDQNFHHDYQMILNLMEIFS